MPGLADLLKNPRRLQQFRETPGNALDYASQARLGRRPASRASQAKEDEPNTLETGEVIEQVQLPDGSLVKPATESGRLVKAPGKSNLYLDPTTGEPYNADPTQPTGLRSAWNNARQVTKDGKVFKTISGVGERELGPDPKAAEDAAKAEAKRAAEDKRQAFAREQRKYLRDAITGEPVPLQTDEEWAAAKQAKQAKLDEGARVKRLKDQADVIDLEADRISLTAPKPAKEDEEAFNAAESALSQFAAGQDMEKAAAKYAAAPATDEASQQAKAAAENYLAYKDKVKPAKEAEKKVQELKLRALDIKEQIINPQKWKAGKTASLAALPDDDLVAEVKAQADIINEQEEQAVGTLDTITKGRNAIVAELNSFNEEFQSQAEQGLTAEEMAALDIQKARLEQSLADYDEHNGEAKAESDAALKAAADRRDVLAVAGTELEGRAAKQAKAAATAKAKSETLAKAKPLYEGWAKGLYSDDWRTEEETPRLAQEAAKAGLDVASAKEALQTYRQLDWSNTRRDPKTGQPIAEEVRTLPDGNVTVNPTMWGDAEAYKKAVDASQGTPEGKAKALKAFPKLQEIHAEKAVEILSQSANIPGADNFMAWRERKIEEDQATQGKLGFARQSPAKQAIAYMEEMKNRSWFRKAGEQVGLGLLAGFQDIATQALGVGAMVTGSETLADLAAANTENTQSVVGAQNLEGSDTDYALRVMGMGARMTPAVAAMIAGAGAVGGGLGTAAVLAGGQTAGSMFADLYRTAKEDAGLSHGEAWRKAALPAALAGTITGLLTKGMGATGLERVFSDTATQETARNTFKAMLGQFVKGAAEELPEEIADEYFTTILQESAASADPVATFKNFANTLPELAGVTALMGGAGALMQARRQAGTEGPGMAPPPEAGSPAMPVQPRPAELPSISKTGLEKAARARLASLRAKKDGEFTLGKDGTPEQVTIGARLTEAEEKTLKLLEDSLEGGPNPDVEALAAAFGYKLKETIVVDDTPTSASADVAEMVAKFNPTGATPLPQSVAATAKRTGRPPAAVARQAAAGVVKIAQGQSLESLDIEEQEALGFVNKGGKITPDTKVTPLIYLYKDKPVLRNAAAEWLTDEAQEGLAGMVNLTEAERKAQIDAEAAAKAKPAAKKKAGQAKPATAESTPQAGPEVKTSDSLSENESSNLSPASTLDAEMDRAHAEWQAGKKEVDDAFNDTEPHSQERKEAREKRKQWEEKNGQVPPPSSSNPLSDLRALSNKDSDSKFSLAGTGWRLTGVKETSIRGKTILYVTNGKAGGWVEESDLTEQHRQILNRSNPAPATIPTPANEPETVQLPTEPPQGQVPEVVPVVPEQPPAPAQEAPPEPAPAASQPAEPALTPTQADQMARAQAAHEKSKATIQRMENDPEIRAKKLYAEGMRFAAIKRQITGKLTGKEQEAKAKREASNYEGKAVSVDGKNAEVIGNAFGKVKVKFEDGTKATVPAAKIKPPVEAVPAPEAGNYLDRVLDAAIKDESMGELTIPVPEKNQNRADLDKAIAAIEKRGLTAATDGKSLLVRGFREMRQALAQTQARPQGGQTEEAGVSNVAPGEGSISPATATNLPQEPAQASQKEAAAKPPEQMTPEEAVAVYGATYGEAGAIQQVRLAVKEAIKFNLPANAAFVDAYGIALPEGYTREGDLYVYRPDGKAMIMTMKPGDRIMDEQGRMSAPMAKLKVVQTTKTGHEIWGIYFDRDGVIEGPYKLGDYAPELEEGGRIIRANEAAPSPAPASQPAGQAEAEAADWTESDYQKSELLEREARRTDSPERLAEILKQSAGLPSEGRIANEVANRRIASDETFEAAAANVEANKMVQPTYWQAIRTKRQAQPAQPPRPATPEGRAEAALAEYEAEVRKALVGKPSKAAKDLAARKLDLAKRLRARLKAMAGAVDFDVYAKDLRAKSGELEVKPVGRKGSILFINPEKLINRLTAKHATTEAGREAMDVFILHEFIHKAAIGNMDGAKIIGLYNLLTPEAKAASKALYLADSGLTDFQQEGTAGKEFAAAHEWFAQLVEARLRGKISNQAEIEASQDPAFRDRLMALLRDFVAQLRDIAKLVTDKAEAARIEAEADAVQAIVADMATKAGLEIQTKDDKAAFYISEIRPTNRGQSIFEVGVDKDGDGRSERELRRSFRTLDEAMAYGESHGIRNATPKPWALIGNTHVTRKGDANITVQGKPGAYEVIDGAHTRKFQTLRDVRGYLDTHIFEGSDAYADQIAALPADEVAEMRVELEASDIFTLKAEAKKAGIELDKKATKPQVIDALMANAAQAKAGLEIQAGPEAAPQAPASQDEALKVIDAAIRRYDERSRPYEGGQGIAVGAENANDRIAADALMSMKRAVREGKDIDEALKIAIADAHEMVRNHNRKRPKDINWQRWEGTADSILTMTAANAKSAKPAASAQAQPAPQAEPAQASQTDEADKALAEAFTGLFLPPSNQASLRLPPQGSLEQTDLPRDRRDAMMKAASVLVDAGVKTPAELAARLDKLAPGGQLRQYSRAFWRLMTGFDSTLEEKPDWQAVYQASPAPVAAKADQTLWADLSRFFASENSDGSRAAALKDLKAGTASDDAKGYLIDLLANPNYKGTAKSLAPQLIARLKATMPPATSPEAPTTAEANVPVTAEMVSKWFRAYYGGNAPVTKVLPGLFKIGDSLYGLYSVNKLTDQQVLNGVPFGDSQMLIKEEETAEEVPALPASVTPAQAEAVAEEAAMPEPAKQAAPFDAAAAKGQKKFLLAEVAAAVKAAPKRADMTQEQKDAITNLEDKFRNWDSLNEEERKTYASELAAAKADAERLIGYVTIEVPGDGTFTILNEKEALYRFQKKADKFPVSQAKDDLPAKPTAQAPTAVPALKKAKTTADVVAAVFPMVSTDTTRGEGLQKVKGEGAYLWATNGRFAVRVEHENGGGKGQEAIVYDEKGNAQPWPEGEQNPTMEAIIPDDKAFTPYTLDTARWFSLMSQARAVIKDLPGETGTASKAVSLYRNPDGSLGLFASDVNRGDYAHNIQPEAQILAAYNPDYFQTILRVARNLGHEQIELRIQDDVSPATLRAGNALFVLMPMRINGAAAYSPQPARPAPPVTAEAPAEPKAVALRTQDDTPYKGKTPQELLEIAAPYEQTGENYNRNIAEATARMRRALEMDAKFWQLNADELAVRLEKWASPAAATTYATQQKPVKGQGRSNAASTPAPDVAGEGSELQRKPETLQPDGDQSETSTSGAAAQDSDEILLLDLTLEQERILAQLPKAEAAEALKKGLGYDRPQTTTHRLPSDPWVYMDRQGEKRLGYIDQEGKPHMLTIEESAEKRQDIARFEAEQKQRMESRMNALREDARIQDEKRIFQVMPSGPAYYRKGGKWYERGTDRQLGRKKEDGLALQTLEGPNAALYEVKVVSEGGTMYYQNLRQASPAAAPPAQPGQEAAQPAQAPAPEGQGGAKPAKAEAGIADFGAKLGGARKDKVATVNEELSDDEIAGKTLSEIWPKSEIASIEDDELAAFATTLRGVIPTKPQKGYKLNAWVAKVKMVKELMRHATEKGVPEMISMLRSTKYNLGALADKVALLQGIDRTQWDRIGEVRNYPDAYRYGEGVGNMTKIPSPHAEAEVDGRRVRADNLDTLLEAVVAKVSEGKAEAKMQFEVRGRTGKWGINKKGDPLYRKLKTFEDSKEALAYVTSNYADLVAAWEGVKERDNIKETDLRKTENRPRTAEDWRKGKDATPEMFAQAFGFRGVEFGNWVSQGANAKERQGMMNEAYDALHDLASILSIPTKALSLNGQIGLGFGSRGKGWASAHYEPGNLVINLTKTRGAGSLAHELFHAFDHYFGRARGASIKNNAGVYITNEPETRYVNEKTGHSLSVKRWNEIKDGRGRISNEADWKLQKGVRPEVEEAFTALVKALDDSPMAKRASLNDKGKQGYWGSTIERAARSFENYVIYKMQQKGYQNDYLANVVRIEDFVRDPGRYPYLLDEEIEPVAKAFDDLFATIKTRETDSGVALYNPPSQGSSLPPAEDELGEVAEFYDLETKQTIRSGEPVTFNYARNNTPAFRAGATFQQDIEPAGRYLSPVSKEATNAIPSLEYGEIAFKSPLVLEWRGYGEDGWKKRLSARFGGKKGKVLSKAIAAAGYDGIITVSPTRGGQYATETVDLRMFRPADKGQPASLALPPAGQAVTPAQDAEYLAAVAAGDLAKAQAMVDEKLASVGAMWHGTPSGDLQGGTTGLHIGTRQAATEALEARIGIPADGKGWDGSREYGKTLLAGKDRINSGQFGKYRLSGYNTDAPNADYYPTKMPTVGKSVPVDPTWKPWLRPVLIVGEMTNTRSSPISDAAANRKIQRKRGAFYTNEGEDAGSVSAVLPNGESVRVKLADPVTRDESGEVIPLSERFNPASPSILRNPPAPEGGPAASQEARQPEADEEADPDLAAFMAEQQRLAEEEAAVREALRNDPDAIDAVQASGAMSARNLSKQFEYPEARAVYQALTAARDQLGGPETVQLDKLRKWAKETFESDPEKYVQWAADMAEESKLLDVDEQAVLGQAFQFLTREARLTGDKNIRALLNKVGNYYLDTGTRLAQAMSARRDPLETPQERWTKALDIVFGPSEAVRRKLRILPTAAGKARRIASLEAELAEARGSRRADVEAALKTARAQETKEELLEKDDAESEKIKQAVLKNMGVTEDDLMLSGTDRHALQSAILDLPAVKTGLEAYKGKDNDGYNIMRLAFRGFSDEHIANALNLNQDDVGKFIHDATAAIIRPAVAAQVKAGTGFGGLIKAGFAKIKKAVGLGLPPSQDGGLDKEYMDAVQAGDLAKAQRMVDETRLMPRKVHNLNGIEVIRNPKDSDYKQLNAEYRKEYPFDKSGDPTTRFTTDAFGNRWIWRSDLGMHSLVEPRVEKAEGKTVGQNEFNWNQENAEPVVRDKSGAVIPLSQRFNAASPSSLRLPPKAIEAQPALIKGKRQTVDDVTAEVNRVMAYALQSAKARNSGKLMSKVVMTPGGQRVRVFVPFDPDDMANYYAFAREYTAAKASAFDKVYEYWINWPLLSGPQTQVANITGNAAQVAWHYTGQRLAEATLNLAYQDPNAPQFREFKHILKGFWQGIGPAFEMARETFLTEGDTIRHKYLGQPLEIDVVDGDLDKVGNIRASVGGQAGRISRLPGRVLRFTDAFFKTAIMYAEASAVAYRRAHVEAKRQGLKGQARAAFIDTEIANTLNDTSSAVWGEVMKTAEELLFQDDNSATEIVDTVLGGYKGIKDLEKLLAEAEAKGDSDLAAKLQKRIRSRKFVGSLMRWIFPFQRTPTNIVRAGIKKAGGSAISLLYGLTRAGWLAMGKDGVPVIKSYPKAMQIKDASETLLAGLGWLALASMLEGDDNDDEKPVLLVGTRSHSLKERAATDQFLRKYGGENSIVWQDGKGKVLGSLPFGRYEPAATTLTTWIDAYRNYQEVKRLKSQGENASYTTYMLSSLVSSLEDKSFLQGFANAMQFVRDVEEKRENPDQNAGVKMLMNNVIPNLIKQPLRNMDDVLRERTTAGPGYAALPNPTIAPKLPVFAAQPKISTTGERLPKAFTPPARLLFQANTKVTPQPDALLYRANRLHPTKRWSPQPLQRDDYTADPPGKAKPVPITDPAKKRQFAELAGRLYAAKAAQVAAKAMPSEKAQPGESLIKAFKKAREDAMAAARAQAHAMGLHKATATP